MQNKIQGHLGDIRASAARCTAIPTSGPHSSAITVRVSSPSGSSSRSADASVADTQPTEYARCSAAATAAAPVSVNNAIATAAPVSQANSSPSARYSAPNPSRSSHGPNTPASRTPSRPSPVTTRAGCTSPRSRSVRWSTKCAIRLPCMAVSGTSSGALVSVTARITTPPVAPRAPEVALSSTGKPITRIALAPAAAIECDAPRRNVTVPPGVSSRAAARVAGDATSKISHATEPATVAQRYPTSPQPIRNVAAATATRRTASVTINEPYWVHRFTPASMPISVVWRQNPASPTLSNATLSHCDRTNTCADHSGELAAITAAATTPAITATRSGCVSGPGSDVAGAAAPATHSE